MKKALAVGLLFLSFLAYAQMPGTDTNVYPDVKLGWNIPTNPIVAGVNLYYGGKSGVYTNKVSCGMTNQVSIYGLVAGYWYYFAATTYSASGAESELSQEVSWAYYLETLTNHTAIFALNGAPIKTNTFPLSSPFWCWSNGLVGLNSGTQQYFGTNQSKTFKKLTLTQQFYFKQTP